MSSKPKQIVMKGVIKQMREITCTFYMLDGVFVSKSEFERAE